MVNKAIKTSDETNALEHEDDHQLFNSSAPLEIKDGLSSPARQLQSYLENHWDDREAAGYEDDRWSIRRMVAIVFLTCTAFWAGVILLGQALF